MAVYRWRKRPTQHFGEISVPYAQIDLRYGSGKYQALSLQVDSGAVVSILRCSVADLLGLDLKSGRRIELSGVGGGLVVAFVHELEIRFDMSGCVQVPFAFAENEAVPNLLGRAGVFDRLQVDFDATLEETRITAPWLNPNQRTIWECLSSTEQHILDRWSDVEIPEPAREVARRFVRRGAQLLAAAVGLMKLHRSYAAPMFIRSMFDLAVQFEYLMKEPAERAQQYLDFAIVTRYQMGTKIVENPTGPVSQFLAASPDRRAGEIRNRSEYERVKEQFVRGKGSRLWPNWYCKTISKLAAEVGWGGEYRLWYAMGSAWEHADPFQNPQHSMFTSTDHETSLLVCGAYYARLLLLVSENLVLTAEQFECLKKLGKNIS